jgi:fibro-slime domain-containing protein
MRLFAITSACLTLALFAAPSCSGTNQGSEVNGPSAGTGGIVLTTGGMAGALPGAGTGGIDTGVFPPAGFGPAVQADVGAYSLGPEYLGSGGAASGSTGGAAGSSGQGCSALLGLVRDFKMGNQPGGHPDFETFTGDGLQGIVENTLGADGKPVYAHTGATIYTTGPDNFNQWYRDVPGVNRTYYVAFQLESTDGLVFTFFSTAFFPLDGAGWGNQGEDHNFSFTTELHTTFQYNGGEVFTFTGDDDLWVFLNHHLAIDLGGLHSSQTATVSLDDHPEFGLTIGGVYEMALFHAERHTNESNFRIDTTMHFVDCGIVPPLPPQ